MRMLGILVLSGNQCQNYIDNEYRCENGISMDALPELSVRHMRAIIALARFENFVAAAAYLRISQPGLTRLVQQTEKRIGVQLFVRSPKGVKQTEAGQNFVPACERILSDLTQQVLGARALDGQIRGQITISSLMSISHYAIPQALLAFRQQHPHIHVHVREGLNSSVHADVRNGQVDFGIGNIDGKEDGITIEAIAEEPCFVVLPRDHTLATARAVSLKQLSQYAFISMPLESGLRRVIDVSANAQDLTLDHSITTNQFGSLFEYVANGLGVAIVPAAAIPVGQQDSIVVKALRPQMKRRIGILRQQDRVASPASDSFLEIFRTIFLASIRGQH
jgi:DNA-binding transcriptional LysR family regulator